MDAKYFHVQAMDGAQSFIATGSFNHKFHGVTEVTDEVEYTRLKDRGCREITQVEYEDALKKKAQTPHSLEAFHPAPHNLAVQLVAEKVTPPKSVDVDAVRAVSQFPARTPKTASK